MADIAVFFCYFELEILAMIFVVVHKHASICCVFLFYVQYCLHVDKMIALSFSLLHAYGDNDLY